MKGGRVRSSSRFFPLITLGPSFSHYLPELTDIDIFSPPNRIHSMDSTVKWWDTGPYAKTIEESQSWKGPGRGASTCFPTRHLQRPKFYTHQVRLMRHTLYKKICFC